MVRMTAIGKAKNRFRWIGGCASGLPSAPMGSLPDKMAVVYAPIAKNAMYPRSSRPAQPTTTLSPRAASTYTPTWPASTDWK